MSSRTHFPKVFSVVLLSAVVAGCASDADRLRAFLREPPEMAMERPVSGKHYRVLPPDVLRLQSLRVPEISGVSQQVRPDGKINLPLVGEITVAGKTPKEIEEAINEAASDYYEQVDATVEVAAYRSQNIYVFGQVSRPGPQPWTGTNTLLDLLGSAQPTTLAWPERILVVRGQQPTRGGYLPDGKDLDEMLKQAEEVESLPEPGNGTVAKVEAKKKGEADTQAGPVPADPPKATIMRINLMAMIKKGDLSKNVYLLPDDVVYVPPNPLAAVGLAIQQVLFPIRPATETIRLPATAVGAAAGMP